MKHLLTISRITFLSFFFLYGCSTEENNLTPTVQYFIAATAGEGGSLSTEGGIYDDGTEVNITAKPADGYEFAGWEGIDSTETTITVIVNSNTNITAEFRLILGVTNMTAIGVISEQTIVEAKKIIYGKWDFENSSKSLKSSKKNNSLFDFIEPVVHGKKDYNNSSNSSRLQQKLSCSFDFIEFTDESYIMSLEAEGDSYYVSGDYVINATSDGKVSSVDLKYNNGSGEITIATLTDVIVVLTNSSLNATFNIELNIPEESDVAVCSSLSGNFSAEKDEPLEASSSATPDSNHAKLIKTWVFDSVFRTEEPNNNQLDYVFEGYCLDYDYNETTSEYEEIQIPNCSAPTSIMITFSTYGTYTMYSDGGSDGLIIDEIDSWDWLDSNQNEIVVGEDEYETFNLTIESITDTLLILTVNDDYYDEETGQEISSVITYALSAK